MDNQSSKRNLNSEPDDQFSKPKRRKINSVKNNEKPIAQASTPNSSTEYQLKSLLKPNRSIILTPDVMGNYIKAHLQKQMVEKDDDVDHEPFNDDIGENVLELYDKLNGFRCKLSYNTKEVMNFVSVAKKYVSPEVVMSSSVQQDLISLLYFYGGDSILWCELLNQKKLYNQTDDTKTLYQNVYEFHIRKKKSYDYIFNTLQVDGPLRESLNLHQLRKIILYKMDTSIDVTTYRDGRNDPVIISEFQSKYNEFIFFPEIYTKWATKSEWNFKKKGITVENLKNHYQNVNRSQNEHYRTGNTEKLRISIEDLLDVFIEYIELHQTYTELFNSKEKHELKSMVVNFEKIPCLFTTSILSDFKYRDCINIVLLFRYFKDLYMEDVLVASKINNEIASIKDHQMFRFNTEQKKMFNPSILYFKFKNEIYCGKKLVNLMQKFFVVLETNLFNGNQLKMELYEFMLCMLFFTSDFNGDGEACSISSELSEKEKKTLAMQLFPKQANNQKDHENNIETLNLIMNVMIYNIVCKSIQCQKHRKSCLKKAMEQVFYYFVLSIDLGFKSTTFSKKNDFGKNLFSLIQKVESFYSDYYPIKDLVYSFVTNVVECCDIDGLDHLKNGMKGKDLEKEGIYCLNLKIALDIFE